MEWHLCCLHERMGVGRKQQCFVYQFYSKLVLYIIQCIFIVQHYTYFITIVYSKIFVMVCAFLLGFGDSCYNTQVNLFYHRYCNTYYIY